jgi:hypothetical protein
LNLLNHINHGAINEGLRIVIVGQEKIGKTTLACQAPDALLIPLEIGYGGINIPKVPMLQAYHQIEQLLNEIEQSAKTGSFSYRNIIFDSATALERHIHEMIVSRESGKTTMETALGGYGKAYVYANEIFDSFLKRCDILATLGKINIILTCHTFAAKLIDPNIGEYDSWDLLLHSPKNQKTYGKRELLTQWADIVGFMYEPMLVSEGEDITRIIDAKKGRVLGVSRTPSYVAGNRFGIDGEIPIPKKDGWNYFADAIYKSSGIDIFNRNL